METNSSLGAWALTGLDHLFSELQPIENPKTYTYIYSCYMSVLMLAWADENCNLNKLPSSLPWGQPITFPHFQLFPLSKRKKEIKEKACKQQLAYGDSSSTFLRLQSSPNSRGQNATVLRHGGGEEGSD